MRIDIKTDASAVQRLLRTLPQELADKAMARTLNAAVAQGKTRINSTSLKICACVYKSITFLILRVPCRPTASAALPALHALSLPA